MNAEHPEFEEYLATVKYDRLLSVKNKTQDKWFSQIVSALIHLSYTPDDESALLRQKDKDEEHYKAWQKWDAYAEDAKARARVFVYGVQQQSVTG